MSDELLTNFLSLVRISIIKHKTALSIPQKEWATLRGMTMPRSKIKCGGFRKEFLNGITKERKLTMLISVMVEGAGLEPTLSASKTDVLPLHNPSEWGVTAPPNG